MPKYQALNQNEHQTLKIQSDHSFSHSASSHVAPLTVFELSQAQADYPIVFIKDAQTGNFHLVALLGLKPNENLFTHPDGWRAEYVPLQLRSYPLMLTQSPNQQEQIFVAVDIESSRVSTDKGNALFEHDGTQTKFLKNIAALMSQVNAQLPATQDFIRQLVDNDLLSAQSVTVKNKKNEEINLTGLYVVDETKFNDLSMQAFVNLKEQQLIAPIYACLFSLQRISRLIALT